MMLKWKRTILLIFAALMLSSGWIVPAGLIYGGDQGSRLQNLEFINVDLRQVFRSLAASGKFNAVLDQTVKGNVSVAFKAGVTAREAVAVIATNYGYSYQWIPSANQVFVGNIKEYSKGFGERIPVDIELKYSEAAAIAGSLEVVIPKERIKTDSNGYKVTVFGNSLEIQNAKEIVSRIDRRLSAVNLEIKIAEVADDFWKDTGINLAVIRSHIGVYSLAQSQLKLLESGPNSVIHYLTQRNIYLLDNQDGTLSLADKFPKNGPKENKASTNSALPEYVLLGTTVGIKSWVSEGNRITLQLKESTEVVTNQPKDNVSLIPVTRLREVTSTISVADRQTLLLTGLIGRTEYHQIRKIPGTYPVLQELFRSNNGFDAIQKQNALVIMLITPSFSEKPADSGSENKFAGNQSTNQVLTSNQAEADSPAAPGNDATAKSANEEPKTEKNADISGTGNITLIEYPVKTNDTITGLAIKFGIERQTIITVNQLENKKEIPGILLIPIPNDRVYIVKPKETLWRIAKRYDTTIDLLKDLNSITDITQLKAGQTIVLPVSTNRIINPQF